MTSFRRFTAWADAHRDRWLDCVRIYLGIGLFARGVLLITNNSSNNWILEKLLQSGQSGLATGLLMHFVTLAHLVGGAMLTFGLYTRFAAIIQMPNLLGAIILVHWQEGVLAPGQGLEFSGLVLFLLVVFAVSGGGEWSVDHSMIDKPAESHPPGQPHHT
jgi:putative oxidoreductase